MATAGPRSRAGWSVLAAATLWGTTGTAAALAPHGSSALAVGAGGMGGGGLLLALMAGPAAMSVLRDRAARRLLVAGAGLVAVYPLAFYTAMHMAGVALGVTVTIGCSPVAAALVERVVDGRRLSGRWAAATALALAGACVLGLGGRPSAGPGGPAIAAGLVLGLVAGAAYAGYAFTANRLMAGGSQPHAVMGATFGLAALPLLAILAVAGSPLVTNGRGLAVLGYLAVVPMGAGYVLFGRGLRAVPSSAATALSLLEPAVAAVLAEVVLGQRLDGTGWAGIALVAAGVVVLASPARPTPAAIRSAT